jgi:hypothetical protein
MFFFMQYIYIYVTKTFSLIDFLQSLGKIHCRDRRLIEPNNYIYFDYPVRNPNNKFKLRKFKFYHTYIS